MPQNAIIGYNNLIDSATLTGASFSNLTNIQNRMLNRQATAPATAPNNSISISLPFDRNVRVIGLANHNLSTFASWTINCFNSVGTLVYSSGQVAIWPTVMLPAVSLLAQPETFYGVYDPAIDDDAGWKGNNPIAQFILPASVPAISRIDVYLFDQYNPTGTVAIGRMFVGKAWQPRVNPQYGFQLGFETSTEVAETLSSAEYFDVRPNYRTSRFSTAFISEDEAFNDVYEICGRSGINREVWFSLSPDDAVYSLRKSIYGRIRQLSAVEWPYPVTLSVGWEIKELF